MFSHKTFNQVKFFFFIFFLTIATVQCTYGNTGYLLQPVSGADGVFGTVNIDGITVYRTTGSRGTYQYYMYFRCEQDVRRRTVYLEVTYKDIGYGNIGVQFNSTSEDYKLSTRGYENFVLDTGRDRTAVFELTNADFRNAQNLQSDLRLCCDGSFAMNIISATIYLEPTQLFNEKNNEDWISPYTGPEYIGDNLVDANTLTDKVISGYQGWFRAGGDPSGQGWVHYVHGDFSDLTVEMWPDMSEYSDAEKYPVPGWTYSNGEQACLFSSANKKTVIRHFQWMESYGIDGVAVQRFVSGLNYNHPRESFRIPGYAREAANRTGRTYFIMYDMSGDENVTKIRSDWYYLVDTMKITEDGRYLHHDGKPVVGVFGFFSDRFAASLGNQILDIFQNDGPYQAFVVGSGQWWWRSETDTGWPEVFRRMDAWIPWNVGNYSGSYASTNYWREDKYEMDSSDVLYMPLIYPGFGWDNLQNQLPGTTTKPRLKGKFMWKQFLVAKSIGAEAVYIAMFDEIDEGTAIFKVTNDIPVNHYFLTLEGLPSDFYLLLTGFGTKMINGQVSMPNIMPDFAAQSQPPVPDILLPLYGDAVENPVLISWTQVSHASGITGYELEIDGQVTVETTTEKTIELVEGPHTLRVRAINGLNIKGGFSEAVIFTISTNNLDDIRL
ncbi:MAG: hypothetical protein JW715_17250 [Sedimentisphaerales bacterium]|nr:hypothetical protein [Sedimentisphaerales bacterium]